MLNVSLFSRQPSSGLGGYSGVISWFYVSQKSNSDKKQILKEAIRERFIERADVEFVSYPSVRLDIACKPAKR